MKKTFYILLLIIFAHLAATGQTTVVVDTFPWHDDLENTTTVSQWATAGGDENGGNWEYIIDGNYSHNGGQGLFGSASYDNNAMQPLHPDNWLVSPKFALPGNAKRVTLTFWASATDVTDFQEHFNLYLSNNDTLDQYPPLLSATCPDNQYHQYTQDISQWRGDTIQFSIRHDSCTGQYILIVDDFRIEIEYYPAPDTLRDTTHRYHCDADTVNGMAFYVDTTLCYQIDTTVVDTTVNDTGAIVITHTLLHLYASHRHLDTAIVADSVYYFWQGDTLTQSGNYSKTFQSSNPARCDSTLLLHLYFPLKDTLRDTTILSGCDSLSVNGITYTLPRDLDLFDTTITDTATSMAGPTTVHIYKLHIKRTEEPSTLTLDTFSTSYTWYGKTYTQGGYYEWTDKSPRYCVTTHHFLELYRQYTETIQHNECLYYTLGGDTLTTDTVISDTVSSVDSMIITIHKYTVSQPGKIIQFDTTTNVFSFEGVAYKRSGIIKHVYGNCDSMAIINLTLNCETTSGPTLDTVACDSATWKGKNYYYLPNFKSDYRIEDTLINHCGQDSLRQVHFFLKKSSFQSDTVTVRTLYTYRWRNLFLKKTGRYYDRLKTVDGCDSTFELRLRMVSPDCDTSYETLDTTACDALDYLQHHYTADTSWCTYHFDQRSCDSIHTTTIHIYHPDTTTLTLRNCDTLRWEDSAYTSPATLSLASGLTLHGCDSTTMVHLIVGYANNVRDTVAGCDMLKYRNVIYTQTTDDIFTPGHDGYGCDSTIYAHIVVLHSQRSDSVVGGCDSLRYLDSTYKAPAAVVSHYTAANGCDSTHSVNITIYHDETTDNTVRACDFFNFNHRHIYRTSGHYADTVGTTQHGCHKIDRLNLTLFYADTIVIDSLACGPVKWIDNLFTHDTTASATLTNQHHCDSLITLKLTIRENSDSTLVVDACDSYRWHDSTYIATTSASYHVKNQAGCDSSVTLQLTIYHNDTIDSTLHACTSALWRDSLYLATTVDTFYFSSQTCHYAEVLHLTVHHDTTSSQNLGFCDSIVWLDTTYLQPIVRSVNHTTPFGCDSLVTYSMQIYPSTASTLHITECDSFTWHDTTYYESTNQPTFTRNNIYGCDSTITLNLVIKRSGDYCDTLIGCDSLAYADTSYTTNQRLYRGSFLSQQGCDSISVLVILINHGNDTTHLADTCCEEYVWHGSTFITDTVAVYDSTDRYQCHHYQQLNLSLHHNQHAHHYHTACDSFAWGDTTFLSSTTSSTQHTSLAGCDSISTLHLIVNASAHDTIDTAVCHTFAWCDTTIFSNTSQLLRRHTQQGCDSTLLLTLHILKNYGDTTITGCDEVLFAGSTYISDATLADTLTNSQNCDSIVSINIVVNHTATVIDKIHACDSFTWRNGATYYDNATDIDTITATTACDTVVILTLTVDTTVYNQFSATANQPFVWNDQSYDETGTFLQHLTAASECDSVVALNLIYTTLPTPEIASHDGVIIMLNHYPYGEQGARLEYYSYQWFLNGDSIVGATSDIYTNAYQPLDGCYFLRVAINEEQSGWLQSNLECFGSAYQDINTAPTATLKVFPNPALRGNRITISGYHTPASLHLYDRMGRLVTTSTLPEANATINGLGSGTYLLLINDGSKHTHTITIQ